MVVNPVLSKLGQIKVPLYREYIARTRKIPDVKSLLQGDPDFDTPKHIKEAAMRALNEGWTHYPPMGGIPELKEALATYHSRYGTDWNPEGEVIVTPGSTNALYLSLIGTLSRGDEVVFIEPYYMGYTTFVDYLDLKVVPVRLQEESRFHIDLDELREKVTSKTKLILLCSPNNPTGTVFNEKELIEIAELAVEGDFLVISDEIYDQFTWDGIRHQSIAAIPGMRERTIVIMSFSKTFAMTGWRMGSIMADEEIATPLRRVPVDDRPPTFIQRAGVYALNGPWEPIEKFRSEYKMRRDYLVKRLNEIEGITCESPEGAFYLFPNFESVGMKSIEFCEGLLAEEKLAAVPGIAFGDAGEYHMRMPLVKPVEFLEKCATALERYVDKLS